MGYNPSEGRESMRAQLIGLMYLGAATCVAQDVWHDPSPHKTSFVIVDNNVKLEVLDWGGSGRPVVLLAGYLTAHAYDDFAPKLSKFCHVYGITRRGYGSSSRPDSGYTADRSTDDVVQVLDALKLDSTVLVGHSFGGQDLNNIGAKHPDRVAGLVYLNSAEDPTLGPADFGVQPPDGQKLPSALRAPPPTDHSSFRAYRESQFRGHGIAFPEAELRQTYSTGTDGSVGRYLVPTSVRNAMFKGIQKPDYAAIRAPVLAFFAMPPILADQIAEDKPKDDEERAALAQKYASDLAIVNRHMSDLKKGVPSARIIAIPNANFYIFLSNEAELFRDIARFLNDLK
jgi:non-heme chloroperoxidase